MVIDAYSDERPHPLGLIDNPEWSEARSKRADLYIAERARRYERKSDPVEQFCAWMRGFWS